jgi:hypothetical protein
VEQSLPKSLFDLGAAHSCPEKESDFLPRALSLSAQIKHAVARRPSTKRPAKSRRIKHIEFLVAVTMDQFVQGQGAACAFQKRHAGTGIGLQFTLLYGRASYSAGAGSALIFKYICIYAL